MDKNHSNLINRHNLVGGQAVIEGVMMKKDNRVSIAVRKEDGSIEMKNTEFNSVRKKFGLFNKPIIRGIIAFIESLVLSFKTLTHSTNMLDLEEDKKKDGKKKSGASTILIMVVSIILGLCLALVLFTVIPTFVAQFVADFFNMNTQAYWQFVILALIEGGLKVGIFIAYLLAVSLMKDIRRTFEYHGAEHKAIACFESGHELTIKNARKCTRFHPRCGTSFMFVMILLSIIVSCLIPLTGWARILVKILVLPLVMGIGYEYIMYAGSNENAVTKILSAPGLWMQRITTREPSDDQLAIAICSIKAAVPELYNKVDEQEFFITESQNRHHIANVGKKYPKQEPLYSLANDKVDLYWKNSKLEEAQAPIKAGGKTVNVQLKLYKKKTVDTETE